MARKKPVHRASARERVVIAGDTMSFLQGWWLSELRNSETQNSCARNVRRIDRSRPHRLSPSARAGASPHAKFQPCCGGFAAVSGWFLTDSGGFASIRPALLLHCAKVGNLRAHPQTLPRRLVQTLDRDLRKCCASGACLTIAPSSRSRGYYEWSTTMQGGNRSRSTV